MMGDERHDRGDETEWHYPMGQYLDRFTAGDRPGLVMLGAGGNAFIRDLAEGETILVKPPALLFKDPTVAMQLHVEYPHAGMKFWRTWGNRYLWLRLWGPGPGRPGVGVRARRRSRHRLPQHLATHATHVVAVRRSAGADPPQVEQNQVARDSAEEVQ